MVVTATAPLTVVLLVSLSFLCCVAGAALRRWPDKVQAYVEQWDGSVWFVSGDAHRALIHGTGVALTALSLLALLAVRLVA